MRNPAYLSKSRHGIFYFRYPLQRGATLKLSLETRSPPHALRLARALSVLALDEVSRLAQGHIRLDELRARMAKHFESQRTKLRESLQERGPRREEELETLETFIELADQGRLKPSWVEPAFEEYVTDKQLPVDRGTSEYIELQREYATETIGLRKLTVQLHRAAKSGGPTVSQPSHSESRKASVATGPTVAELARDFRNLKRKQGLWKEGTAEARDEYVGVLLELIGGDRPAVDLRVEDGRRVRDSLLDMPTNRTKKAEIRELDINEQLQIEGAKRMAPRTAKAHLQFYNGLFQWAVAEQRINANPFAGLNVVVNAKNVGGTVRLPFNELQLSKMLRRLHDKHSNYDGKPHRFWGPLIGMFSGARLNEICQLTAGDIHQVEGVWVFDINDEGEGSSLKTAAARRKVPVHSYLIENGLLQFCQAAQSNPSKRLFPELSYEPQNGWGRSLSRWFNERFLVELDMKTPQLTFHSLRHTMVSKLINAKAEEPIVKAIVGHQREGVTQSVYLSQGYSMELLKEAIELFALQDPVSPEASTEAL